MATTSVYISGIDESAFSSLPHWATEVTAVSIEETLKKSLKIQTETLSSLLKSKQANNPSAKINTKDVDDSLKELAKETDKSVKKSKKREDDIDKNHKRTKIYWEENKKGSAGQIAMLAVLNTALIAIDKIFQENLNTYDKLNASGISMMESMDGFSNGFESLANLTTLTGVRFTELAAAIIKYNTAVNSFGFTKFAKTIGMASSELTSFGFSSKESADLLGAYLNIQQSTHDVSKKSTEETAESLKKLGKTVFSLSLATGMSRDVIVANAEAISKSTDANILAGQVGAKTAESMTIFLASFKDQNLAKELLTLLSDPVSALNDSFQSLQKVGMGGFGIALGNFMKGLQSVPEEQRAMAYKNFVNTHRQELDAQKKRLQMLAQVGDADAKASLHQIVSMEQQADSIKKVSKEDMERQEASNRASKAFANALENLKALFYDLFTPTETLLNVLTWGLNMITHPFVSFGKLLEYILSPLNLFGVKTTFITTAYSMLGDAVFKVAKLIAPFVVLAAVVYSLTRTFAIFKSIMTLFNAKNSVKGIAGGLKDKASWAGGLFDKVKDKVSGLFDKAKDKASGAGGLKDKAKDKASGAGGLKDKAKDKASSGDGLKGLGKGFAGLGKGIGDGLKGLGKGIAGLGKGIGDTIKFLLTGLANGLAALGKPKVLLGVVALAGISAALWIASKSLAEFTKVSWEDIAKAGVVLVGLTLGIMALGEIMDSGVGAVALLSGAAAMAVMAGALWLVGEAIQAVGDGFAELGKGFTIIAGIDSGKLLSAGVAVIGLATSLTAAFPLLIAGAAGLMAFGAAGYFATPALDGIGSSMEKIAANIPALTGVTASMQQLSDTLDKFTGLDTLKDIVSTINDLSIVKAAAFGLLTATGLGTTSAPVSTGQSPKVSTIDSPSVVNSTTSTNINNTLNNPTTSVSVDTSTLEEKINDQTILMDQMLDSLNSILSTNKESLKYIKLNAS